jgi:hypothetical protein
MDYNSLTPDELNNLTLLELDTLRKTLNQVQRKDLYKKLNQRRLQDLSEHISTNIENLKLALCASLEISLEELENSKQKILDLVEEEKSLEDIELS